MKEKIFIDTDVILDVVFGRKPFFHDSQKILSLIEKNYFIGFTSTLILANCYYIISANKNKNTAAKTLSKLRSIMTVLPFTDKELGESLNSNFNDFKDGIQYFISINNGIDTIITRNISDYKNVDIHVLMPNDFLNLEKIKTIIGLK
ncbi:MAG: PIN domain-containing protein [Spirochaetota bacterium]|nr:PIN domain-containing protein [Spirochaetota bacterium]